MLMFSVLGRSVAVDWAVPKNKFEKDNQVESDGDSSSMEQGIGYFQ